MSFLLIELSLSKKSSYDTEDIHGMQEHIFNNNIGFVTGSSQVPREISRLNQAIIDSSYINKI